MTYSIIPDIYDMNRSLALASEYKANFEYNDFCDPLVYDNEEEIELRISYYQTINRDRSADTMHGAFLGLDIAAADSIIRCRSMMLYEQSLFIAERLGLKGVVFHTGLIGGLRLESYLDNWIKCSVEFWTQKCKEYENLTIYMENSFEREPDIFIRLMEEMKDVQNFKLCLDYGHAVLTDTPIEEWVRKLSPYIGHMHLNDNDLKDDLHLAPGEGSIDFDQYHKLMTSENINVSTLLEMKDSDKIKKALEYMRASYGTV